MTHNAQDYMHSTLTAVIGGTFNFLALLVSMQDIEAWLRVSSLVAGNLVAFLTIWKLVLVIRTKKPIDTEDS